MKFTIKRDVIGNVFQSTITFKNYGTTELTAEEEEGLFETMAPIKFRFQGEISGQFSFDGAAQKVVADEVNGHTITLIAPIKEHTLDKDFSIVIAQNACNVNNNEVGGTLNTKRKIAEAKVVLEEKALIEVIGNTLQQAREQGTTFTTDATILML